MAGAGARVGNGKVLNFMMNLHKSANQVIERVARAPRTCLFGKSRTHLGPGDQEMGGLWLGRSSALAKWGKLPTGEAWGIGSAMPATGSKANAGA